ncbi:MAG: hypothetical protein ACJ77E_18715 [Gaiellaceae bacterium]
MRRSGVTGVPARRFLLVALCLAPIAVVAAGCFSATPTQEDLLVNAARALSGTKSVHVDAAVQVSVTRQTTRTESWSAELRGGIAKPAMSLAGAVAVDKAGGEPRTYPFALRLAAKTLYAQIKGGWYSASLRDLRRQSAAAASAAAGGKPRSLIAKLRRLRAAQEIAKHAFRGTVTRGPELDGQKTWEWQGTVDPEGAVAMAAKYGGDRATLTPGKRRQAVAALEQLARVCRITVVAGSDGKPRRLEITVDADRQQAGKLARAAGQAGDADAVHARLRLDLSHWNEPVEATAPARARPIEQLLKGVVGG